MIATYHAGLSRQNVVVIGNGMVGHRFCERLVEFDTERRYRIVTFCEEPRAAYDRVGLTSFFAHRDAEKLMLARQEWYAENGVELHVGDRAATVDRKHQIVRSDKGVEIAYSHVVLATGSYPFVPPVPGIDKPGVFVYRTIEDLENIIAYAGNSRRCAVIGGGLLGLEAARAASELGLETHVIRTSKRLDASAARRCRIANPRRKNRIAGAPRSSQQDDQGGPRRSRRRTDRVRRRPVARRRHGHRLGRNSAARRIGSPNGSGGRRTGRHPGQRPPRDVRSANLRHRRMRTACRDDLRPGRPRLRNGRSRGGQSYGRASLIRRHRSIDQAQADGRRRGQLRRLRSSCR